MIGLELADQTGIVTLLPRKVLTDSSEAPLIIPRRRQISNVVYLPEMSEDKSLVHCGLLHQQATG